MIRLRRSLYGIITPFSSLNTNIYITKHHNNVIFNNKNIQIYNNKRYLSNNWEPSDSSDDEYDSDRDTIYNEIADAEDIDSDDINTTSKNNDIPNNDDYVEYMSSDGQYTSSDGYTSSGSDGEYPSSGSDDGEYPRSDDGEYMNFDDGVDPLDEELEKVDAPTITSDDLTMEDKLYGRTAEHINRTRKFRQLFDNKGVYRQANLTSEEMEEIKLRRGFDNYRKETSFVEDELSQKRLENIWDTPPPTLMDGELEKLYKECLEESKAIENANKLLEDEDMADESVIDDSDKLEDEEEYGDDPISQTIKEIQKKGANPELPNPETVVLPEYPSVHSLNLFPKLPPKQYTHFAEDTQRPDGTLPYYVNMKIRLRHPEHRLLTRWAEKWRDKLKTLVVVDEFNRKQPLLKVGVATLPTKRKRWTILKGPFVHKKARVQFELAKHQRLVNGEGVGSRNRVHEAAQLVEDALNDQSDYGNTQEVTLDCFRRHIGYFRMKYK